MRRISLKDLGTVHTCLVELWVRGCNSQAVNMALTHQCLVLISSQLHNEKKKKHPQDFAEWLWKYYKTALIPETLTGSPTEWRPAAHIYFEKVLSKSTLLSWGQGSESSKLSAWFSYGTAFQRVSPTISMLQNSNQANPSQGLTRETQSSWEISGTWSMDFHSDINSFLTIYPGFPHSQGAEGSRKGTFHFNLRVPSQLAHINLSSSFT